MHTYYSNAILQVGRIKPKSKPNCCIVAIQLHWQRLLTKEKLQQRIYWMEFTRIQWLDSMRRYFLQFGFYRPPRVNMPFWIFKCVLVVLLLPKSYRTFWREIKNIRLLSSQKIRLTLEVAYGSGAPVFSPFPPLFYCALFCCRIFLPSLPFLAFRFVLMPIAIHTQCTSSLNTLRRSTWAHAFVPRHSTLNFY